MSHSVRCWLSFYLEMLCLLAAKLYYLNYTMRKYGLAPARHCALCSMVCLKWVIGRAKLKYKTVRLNAKL
ncbi:uncharacterized protein HLK63_H02035 [Nakaseomyces glabratus]|nr:uncharacterized protein GW608_H02035 [Nakaseomyces glabratus]UCS26093.1 uncharacterized protein HLK63_H02035 [Nakaseomyces glabratus]UCS31323.1 uncharacterized protein HLK64_H02035 [Nakaseomyces glabratus]UCS36552.1 uncharacterized protein HLK62_H02035 [Nakaseomyces glabratus]